MNTVKTLIRDIRKAKAVFGYVEYNSIDEGEYLQLVKSDAIAIFRRQDPETAVRYRFDNEFLYIN
jgi:hypothetical protein